MEQLEIRPIPAAERIEVLDVLRGLAICGILLGNMQWFSGYGMMPRSLAESGPVIDQVAAFLVHFFVEGKFYSIFSFLFGFGFALQIERAAARGDLKASLFKRRLFWLLVIGLLHAYLLWAGDILSVYAVTGFLLLLFRKKSDRSLLKWAFWLLIIPIFFYILLYSLFVMFAPPDAGPPQDAAGWPAMRDYVANAGFVEIATGFNLEYVVGRYMGLVAEMRFAKLLAMFLLGYYAYRRGFFRDLAAHRPFFRKVLIYGLILGVIGNGILSVTMLIAPPFVPSALGVLGVIGYAIGVAPLALFYIAAVALLWQQSTFKRLLAYIAPVGRMALTNYLLQTVISVFIFYGYGLGYYGSVGFASTVLMALAIFAFQILLSTLWLRHFRYGPMEWIWRQLTYKQFLPLRRPLD